MISKLGTLLHTLKYLKFIQIFYRLYYFVVRSKYSTHISRVNAKKITLNTLINNPVSYSCNEFTFLNKSILFKQQIDWNYSKYGKLWTYNLNYFDFLHQKDISKEQGLTFIEEYTNKLQRRAINDGVEPYPISLRGINWIKFLTKHDINDASINSSLFSQYCYLSKKLNIIC